MKQFVSILVICFLCTGTHAQVEKPLNEKFLERFNRLVCRVNENYSQNVDSVYAWKSERKKIQLLYRERYKYLFSDDQIVYYNELSVKYRRKMIDYDIERIGEKVDTLGVRVANRLNRTGKKISGFLKGVKNKSDENRRKAR